MRHSNPQDIISVLSALRVAAYVHGRTQDEASEPQPPRPFVTISRQAGTGGRSFARQLAARLNAVDPCEVPWTVWDNELVERVASEYHLPAARIDALEDERPSWLEEALGSLAFASSTEHADELTVFHRVTAVIRTLAQMGRVIIVGRGGAVITSGLPGGVHLRLVAPLDCRISATAKAAGITADAAAAAVREKDRNRESFHRRHWPHCDLVPENFTATYNTAAVPRERLLESVLPLVFGSRATARPSVAATDAPVILAQPAGR